MSVGDALLKRSEVRRNDIHPASEANPCQDFAGIYTCTLNDRLDSIFDTIRKSRVHRFIVIDEDSKLKGVLTLSDILEYILLEGVEADES